MAIKQRSFSELCYDLNIFFSWVDQPLITLAVTSPDVLCEQPFNKILEQVCERFALKFKTCPNKETPSMFTCCQPLFQVNQSLDNTLYAIDVSNLPHEEAVATLSRIERHFLSIMSVDRGNFAVLLKITPALFEQLRTIAPSVLGASSEEFLVPVE